MNSEDATPSPDPRRRRVVATFKLRSIGAYDGMQFLTETGDQLRVVELQAVDWLDERQTFVALVEPFIGPLPAWIHDQHVCRVQEA